MSSKQMQMFLDFYASWMRQGNVGLKRKTKVAGPGWLQGALCG